MVFDAINIFDSLSKFFICRRLFTGNMWCELRMVVCVMLTCIVAVSSGTSPPPTQVPEATTSNANCLLLAIHIVILASLALVAFVLEALQRRPGAVSRNTAPAPIRCSRDLFMQISNILQQPAGAKMY